MRSLATPAEQGRMYRAGGPERSSRDERQPDRVLANGIGGDKSERWPGSGEVRLAASKHKRAEVEAILIGKTGVGEVFREIGPGDVDVALDLRLQPGRERVDVVTDKRGVGANRLQRA
jgi:hypothetical protein